jgi:hypothetical protein
VNVAQPSTLPALPAGRLAARSIPFLLLAVWLLCGAAAFGQAHDDLAAKTNLLAGEQRWADVVSICEPAARKGTLAPELQQRYDLAKIHCDLAKRHAEHAFRAQLAKLSEADARRVYGEVLSRIASHHFETPDYGRLVSRGSLAMDVAIDDPLFTSLHAPHATPERRTL